MARFSNKVGLRFGTITVIDRMPDQKNKPFFVCQCDCGHIMNLRSDFLNENTTCKKCRPPKTPKNMIGRKFGKLTVTSFIQGKKEHAEWECTCECDNTIIKKTSTLKNSKNLLHCGCSPQFGPKIRDKIGLLTIIDIKKLQSKYQYQTTCQCECGNTITRNWEHLKSNHSTKHCGCQPPKNLVGQKSGKLTVIQYAYKKGKRYFWICQCVCGKTVVTSTKSIQRQEVLSCGCIRKETHKKDITGQKFGRLTALYPTNENNYGNTIWVFNCECGTTTKAPMSRVTTGKKKSCGCLEKENKTPKYQVGDTVKHLTILEILPKTTKFSKKRYKCRCDCGNTTTITRSFLEKNQDCGCTQKTKREEIQKQKRKIQKQIQKKAQKQKEKQKLKEDRKPFLQAFFLIGQTFKDATVTGILDQPKNDKRPIIVSCVCKCGTTYTTTASSLTNGSVGKCLCHSMEFILHGSAKIRMTEFHPRQTHTPGFWSWFQARERCHNPNNNKFPDYGRRGIQMCPQWRESFEQFLKDMGEKPKDMTLDRIDPNGNYSPENCRWADIKTQANNKRRTIFLEYNNQKKSLSEWADILKMEYKELYKLHTKGVTIKQVIENTHQNAA